VTFYRFTSEKFRCPSYHSVVDRSVSFHFQFSVT